MKKTIFYWMLMTALTVGLGTIVTACSDDNDDNVSAKMSPEDAAKMDIKQVPDLQQIVYKTPNQSPQRKSGVLNAITVGVY